MTTHPSPTAPGTGLCHPAGPPMDVVAWRLCRLREAGFTPSLAASLAVMQIDLHALLQLVDRGCPPKLAARILSPFDDRHTVVDPARSDGIEMASGAGESARSR